MYVVHTNVVQLKYALTKTVFIYVMLFHNESLSIVNQRLYKLKNVILKKYIRT